MRKMTNERPILAYVAGRYSGANRAWIDLNIQAAKHCALILMEMGYFPVCPNMNTAHFDDYFEKDVEFYYRGDMEILKNCNLVVMVQGWKDSEGAVMERKMAKKLVIPVFDSVDDVPFRDEFVKMFSKIHSFVAPC